MNGDREDTTAKPIELVVWVRLEHTDGPEAGEGSVLVALQRHVEGETIHVDHSTYVVERVEQHDW